MAATKKAGPGGPAATKSRAGAKAPAATTQPTEEAVISPISPAHLFALVEACDAQMPAVYAALMTRPKELLALDLAEAAINLKFRRDLDAEYRPQREAAERKHERVVEKFISSLEAQKAELDNELSHARPLAVVGQRFRSGRRTGTVGPVRKAIAKRLIHDVAIRNPDLWNALLANPPRGWTFSGKGQEAHVWVDGHGAVTRRRFDTIAGEERAKLR